MILPPFIPHSSSLIPKMKAFLSLPAHRQGILAVAAGALLWSTSGVFIKLLPFDAFTILFYRSGLAALFYAVLFRRQLLEMNARAWVNSVVYCLVLLSFVSATKMTTAANAILLQYTAPVYVLLAEPMLFKTRLERVNVITILICLAGMVILVSGDLAVGDWVGNLLALVSGITLAALILGQRRNAPEFQDRSIFWGNVFVALVGLPFALQAQTPTVEHWLMFGWLGFIQLGVGNLLFFYGLKRVLAVESALLGMMEPIFSPIWVLIFYGEKPSTGAVAGGILMMIALAGRAFWLEVKRGKTNREI